MLSQSLEECPAWRVDLRSEGADAAVRDGVALASQLFEEVSNPPYETRSIRREQASLFLEMTLPKKVACLLYFC